VGLLRPLRVFRPLSVFRTTPVLLLILLSVACGRSPNVTPPTVARGPGPESRTGESSPDGPSVSGPTPSPAQSAFVQEGQASWYGDPYDGRRAASGEIFDKNKLTAAHRTLAFDTWVRVENLRNGRTVDVRINDRGPFVSGRIIDVSEAAARQIELIGPGVAPVRVTVLEGRGSSVVAAPPAPPTDPMFYVVQLGAFSVEANARSLVRELEPRYTGIYVEPPSEGSALHRVLIGRANLADAQSVQDQLRSQEGIDAIVLQVAD
jgi:peptidoglycan lytic transglycosylase